MTFTDYQSHEISRLINARQLNTIQVYGYRWHSTSRLQRLYNPTFFYNPVSRQSVVLHTTALCSESVC